MKHQKIFVIKNMVTGKYSSGETSRTKDITKATIYSQEKVDDIMNDVLNGELSIGRNEMFIEVKITEA